MSRRQSISGITDVDQLRSMYEENKDKITEISKQLRDLKKEYSSRKSQNTRIKNKLNRLSVSVTLKEEQWYEFPRLGYLWEVSRYFYITGITRAGNVRGLLIAYERGDIKPAEETKHLKQVWIGQWRMISASELKNQEIASKMKLLVDTGENVLPKLEKLRSYIQRTGPTTSRIDNMEQSFIWDKEKEKFISVDIPEWTTRQYMYTF